MGIPPGPPQTFGSGGLTLPPPRLGGSLSPWVWGYAYRCMEWGRRRRQRVARLVWRIVQFGGGQEGGRGGGGILGSNSCGMLAIAAMHVHVHVVDGGCLIR